MVVIRYLRLCMGSFADGKCEGGRGLPEGAYLILWKLRAKSATYRPTKPAVTAAPEVTTPQAPCSQQRMSGCAPIISRSAWQERSK